VHIYKVSFINHGKVYELYAESVDQSELFGFIEIDGLIFGENSSVVIDPGEEKLKTEFNGVSRTLVPVNAIIRIDEVEKQGQSKILDLASNTNITPFPSPPYPPHKDSRS
jgi:hypothetical protein